MTQLTEPAAWDTEVVGYMVNTEPSSELQQAIIDIQSQLAGAFPDALWIAPPESLHITLGDWFAPLVEYRDDKEALYAEVGAENDRVLSQALANVTPIAVRFNEIKAFAGAIIITGTDDGSYAQIRKAFNTHGERFPETKRPPVIIHSSIARYKKAISLEEIQAFAATLSLDCLHITDHFRLVRETRDPMLEFEVLKQYELTD